MNKRDEMDYVIERRKLAEAGGAKTITEAKAAILKEFHEQFDDGSRIERDGLKASGIWCVRKLAAENLAVEVSQGREFIIFRWPRTIA